jgi:hypothetical protein
MPITPDRTNMNPPMDRKLDKDYDRPTRNTVAEQDREAKGASREGNTRWASGPAGGEKDRWKSGRVADGDSYASGRPGK